MTSLDKRTNVRTTSDLDVCLSVEDDRSTSAVSLRLTPEEAALLGQRLVSAAEDAVHESRRRRRPLPQCQATHPADVALRCTLTVGHVVDHSSGLARWPYWA